MPLNIVQILKNILYSKWFWIGVGIFILLTLLYRQWDRFERFFQAADVDIKEGETSTIPETVQDKPDDYDFSSKEEIKVLAQEIYTSIYATATKGTGYIQQKLDEANMLTDSELKFLSQYYRNHITQDTWLYTDIDDEIMPFTTIDEVIMVRLTKVGEKG